MNYQSRRKPEKYLHDYTKIGNDQWASAWHKTESAHAVAYAEMGNFYNGDIEKYSETTEFPNYTIQQSCHLPGIACICHLEQHRKRSVRDHNLRATVDIVNIETGQKWDPIDQLA